MRITMEVVNPLGINLVIKQTNFMKEKTQNKIVKWYLIGIALVLMSLSIWQGKERFDARNGEAGIIFYAAAVVFGIAALAFYFYKGRK